MTETADRPGLLDRLFGAKPASSKRPEPTQRDPFTFKAQLVGAQMIAAWTWRDYPLEFNLEKLITSVGTPPNVWAPLANEDGDASWWDRWFSGYYRRMFQPFHRTYVLDPDWFYTYSDKAKKKRGVEGQRIFVCADPKLPTAAEIVQRDTSGAFSIKSKMFSEHQTPPEVTAVFGGAEAGFKALSAALDYLEAHPDKTVWVASVDAPNFPKYRQPNEASILLILAHPDYDTERKPLAWIHRVSRKARAEFKSEGSLGAVAVAWRAAIEEAARRAGKGAGDIGRVVYDTVSTQGAEGKRFAAFAAGWSSQQEEKDITAVGFDLPRLLGPLGANTGVYTTLVGSYFAWSRNVTVLVASTADDEAASALLITPPENHAPLDPKREFPRARGESKANFPWWAPRLDGRPDWK